MVTEDPFSSSPRSTPKLQAAVLECLSQVALKRTYEPDQIIINEGDDCEAAYFILEGRVHVFKLSLQGRQHTLVQLGFGQAFNTRYELFSGKNSGIHLGSTVKLVLNGLQLKWNKWAISTDRL